MAIDINLNEFSNDDIESRGAASGLIPKGHYVAILSDAKNPEEYNGKTRSRLTFELVGGQYDGRKVFHDLYHSSDKDEKADKTVKSCLIYWGKRLGLFVANGVGLLSFAEGKSDFPDCVGADVVIDVVTEKYEGVERNKISMWGVKTPAEHAEEEAKKKPSGGGRAPRRNGSAADPVASSPATLPGTVSPPPPATSAPADDYSDM